MTADAAFGQAVGSTIWNAPDLYNTPSLAVSAAQSPDPVGTAQTLAHLNNSVAFQSQQQVADKHNGGGWFSHAVHAVTGTVEKGLHVLAKPLGAVQHEYRYLKTVYHQHGFWAGFAESAAVVGAGIAGAAAGTLIGNPELGIAAAEGTGYALGKLTYRDSWDYSQTHGGSIGRDVAHLAGLNDTNSGLGKVVSGAGDLAFDFGADPVILGGKATAIRKGAEGLNSTSRFQALQQVQRNSRVLNAFVNRFGPGTSITSAERVDAAYKAYGGYRRALDHIASLDEGGVVAHYPELQGLADRFGKATDSAQVHGIFRGIADDTEWQQRLQSSTLPSRSVMRVSSTRVLNKLRADISRDQELPLVAGFRRYQDDAGNAQKQFQVGLVGRFLSPRAWQRAVSRKVRTFSGYAPYGIDENTGELHYEFNLMKDDNLQGVLRTMRYALGERTAQKRLTEYINAKTAEGTPDLGLRKQIWGEIQAEVLKAAGFPDDTEAFAHLTKLVRQRAAGAMHTASYGFGHTLADDVNDAAGEDSTQRLALWGHQADTMATFPDFRQLRTAVRDLHGYSRTYGRIDDFAAEKYTNAYFKPMALLSMGFGLRVAAAEAIPAAMRYGAMNMLKSRVAATAAKMNYKLAAGEEGHILAAASKFVGGDKLVNGVNKLINDPNARDLALRTVIANEGHITHGVASAGHSGYSVPDDPNQAVAYGLDQSLKRHGRFGRVIFDKPTGDWMNFAPEDGKFVGHWHYGLVRLTKERPARLIAEDFRDELRRTGSADAAATHATRLEAQRITDLADPAYKYDNERLARFSMQDTDAFAAHRVDDVRNYFTGRDGVIHDEILQKIIDGDNKIPQSMLHDIEPASRPRGVAGEVSEPALGPNVLQNLMTSGFKRTVDPVINYLSREPLYFKELETHWKALQPAIQRGVLTEDGALRVAQTRAVRGILPQIHNTHLKSQLHMMLQNLAPFYFAQEQAMKRAGHLVIRHPEAFREYQMITHGLNDPGFVHVDDQGNRYLLFPGLGHLGAGAMVGLNAIMPGADMFQTGLPMTVQGNMESLRTVIPELTPPGTSPLLAISLSKLASIDPAMAPYVKGVLTDRGYNPDLISAIIPNTALRSIVKSAMGQESDRQMSNAMMSAIQSAAYHHQLPGVNATPEEQQAFMDRIKNNARSVLFIKGIVSMFSPLTPEADQTDFGLRDEFYKLVKSKGSYEAALQAFLKEHGSSAISYTVARSDATTGANIPVAKEAVNFITNNAGLISKHPWGAAFVTPQDTSGGGDAQVLYGELLKSHLRESRTPSDFLKATYSQLGVNEWLQARTAHEQAVAALGNNAVAVDAENRNFSTWQNQEFRATNPIAYDYLFGPERTTNAIRAWQDITSMFNSGQAPDNQQAQLLHGLMQDYERHRTALAQLGTDPSLGHQRQLERDGWKAYLEQKAKDEPLLTNVIESVFQRLETVAA